MSLSIIPFFLFHFIFLPSPNAPFIDAIIHFPCPDLFFFCLASPPESNGNARIATFAQHHMDALRPSATPLQLLREAHPKEHPQVLRRHLGSLGLTGQLALRRCQTLSGGQRSRAAFAILTFKKPHFIVMDEPTNHLDLETVDALVAAVNNYGGGILTVSHDQHFLDKTCSEFWALSDGTLKQFHSLEEAKRFAFAEMKQRLNK